MILTSNRTPADWYPLFPNPVVAAVISIRTLDSSRCCWGSTSWTPVHDVEPQQQRDESRVRIEIAAATTGFGNSGYQSAGVRFEVRIMGRPARSVISS